MNLLLTISLLIVVVCNAGVLWLYFKLAERSADISRMTYLLTQQIDKFAHRTDYDFRSLKTRLADEERDDQRAKRKSRANQRREV